MPHDIMNTMHEMGVPGTQHWLFWLVVIGVFALIFFLIWQISTQGKDYQERKSSTDDKSND